MTKNFWKLMLTITLLSTCATFILGSEIPWTNLKSICFSWPLLKDILYDMAVGVSSSMILVWCIDRIQMRETEKQEAKKRMILYNKLAPVLKDYYDFYIFLYIATRSTSVESDSKVKDSLYFCVNELIEQITKTNPFYKDGCFGDPIKAKAQMSLMMENTNNQKQLEQIMKMSTNLPWYKCWGIEGTKFYDAISQIEKDFPTFFPGELLEKMEELLVVVKPQKFMIDFVEGTNYSMLLPQEAFMPQMPTEFFLDAYKIKDIIRLLDENMAYIEKDSSLILRYRDINFFNERNVCPTIGYSCDVKE